MRKMEKEFKTLSEKIMPDCFSKGNKRPLEWEGAVREKDIKEFIKRETELLDSYFCNEIDWATLLKKRRKLMGKKLTNGKRI